MYSRIARDLFASRQSAVTVALHAELSSRKMLLEESSASDHGVAIACPKRTPFDGADVFIPVLYGLLGLRLRVAPMRRISIELYVIYVSENFFMANVYHRGLYETSEALIFARQLPAEQGAIKWFLTNADFACTEFSFFDPS